MGRYEYPQFEIEKDPLSTWTEEVGMSELAGTPYRPSNGTEGDVFFCKYCELCKKNLVPEGCKIQLRTMAFDIDEPEYPKEWVHDKDGYAICTAFEFASSDA